MIYRVFSQSAGIPVAVLEAQARRFFGMTVEAVSAAVEGDATRLRVFAEDATAEVRVVSRERTAGDLEEARAAELLGRAAGMSDLAARCPAVWSFDASGAPAWLALELAALLASVALGPALPPDGSTLLGVRSAREHAARLRSDG